MKTKSLLATLLGVLALGAMGCANDPNDRLITDMGESLASEGNTQHHFQDPNSGENGLSDPNEVRAYDEAVGSPVIVARIHACQKITYAALGKILSTRGVNVQNNTANSAGLLYRSGAAALGVANYQGRVAEAITASTAAMSKQFDIMVAAAIEIQRNPTVMMSGCPGVQLFDGQGQFTRDGISCLMGKPATANHLTVANDAIAQAQSQGLTQAEGQQIAIAALLEAAHTCE
jgi:hypothetical protein